ncbi:MAG: PAS domain-containing protein [Alphaproteobacteria bacterium]
MFGITDDNTLAQAIVNTVREPILVLDADLRVVAASRSFYLKFQVSRQDIEGRALHALGKGQWDIPALRARLNAIAPAGAEMEGFEADLTFPEIGRRIMLLNARKVFYERGEHANILLAFDDITERRAAELERDHLLHEKELLLQEMQHRVANSLQIIASILLMKARSVASEETRTHPS